MKELAAIPDPMFHVAHPDRSDVISLSIGYNEVYIDAAEYWQLREHEG